MKDIKYSLLLNKASGQFSERGFECILAVVLVLGVLTLLMFFPITGIAIAFVIAPFLCVGFKKYLIAIVNDKFIPIENIFLTYKLALKAFCLKVAYTLISILWGIVFIIPGIVTAINYSMSTFIMAENEKLSALECMVKSKKLVSGNRVQIFIIYLAYAFVILALLCLFMALGIAIKNNTIIPAWAVILASIMMFLFIFVIFVIPYFELSIANLYVMLSNQKLKNEDLNPKKSATPQVRTVNTKA